MPPRARLLGVALPVAVLLAALALCALVLARQIAQHRLERAVTRYERGATAPEDLRDAIARACEGAGPCPAETRLLSAIGEADLARTDPSAIPAAKRAIAAVLAERPDWGPALAVAGAIAALSGDTEAAVADLRRSYAAAPYLRAQAIWRLRFGATQWAALDPATRAAVIEEAAWMARIGWQDRRIAEAALGDSPAGVRFALVMAAEDARPTVPER